MPSLVRKLEGVIDICTETIVSGRNPYPVTTFLCLVSVVNRYLRVDCLVILVTTVHSILSLLPPTHHCSWS